MTGKRVNVEWVKGPVGVQSRNLRQQVLIERARELEKRFGDPVARLAELLSTLPLDDDPFWVELLETGDF